MPFARAGRRFRRHKAVAVLAAGLLYALTGGALAVSTSASVADAAPLAARSYLATGSGGASEAASGAPTTYRVLLPASVGGPSPTAPSPEPGRTFYVSTAGSDDNPGTETRPWRTLYKAGDTLEAGDTAVFEDGLYEEAAVRPYSTFRNSGTAGSPITLRARHKHGAVIKFVGRSDQQKIMVLGQDYVTIQDFEITQDARGTTYDDVLVRCWYRDLGAGQVDGSDHCSLVGNLISNAVEAVKAARSTDALIDGNTIADADIAFGSFNTDRLVFRNNEVVNPTVDGIQTKGGTRDARIYNNVVRATGGNAINVGIYLGGGSCESCGVRDPNGYEGYRIVAYNNVVVTQAPLGFGGIVLQGCDGCAATNNVVVGPGTAIRTIKGPGWGANPVYTNNPTILNNIVQDCTAGADVRPAETTGAVVLDYNLFFNCGSAVPWQAHPASGDPQFVDRLSDWRLKASSPARGRGVAASITGLSGVPVDLSADRDGRPRVVPWSLGVYR